MISIKDIKQYMSHISKLALAAALTLGGLTSCVDENLPACQNSSGSENFGDDPYVLQFKINLSSMSSSGTRDDATAGVDLYNDMEKYEDFVDPSKIYIFFFMKEDETETTDEESHIVSHNESGTYKLFKMIKPTDTEFTMIPVAYTPPSNVTDKDWYVRISIPDMISGIDGETFAQALRDHDFKIAVMANVDPNKSIAMQEATVTPETDPLTGAVTKKIKLGSDMNMLHRQSDANDPYVKSDNAKKTYKFLYNDGEGFTIGDKTTYMGHYTNWVYNREPYIRGAIENGEKGEIAARTFIQENWNPDGSFHYRDYTDLWSLWNFGALQSDNAIPYAKFRDEWWERNGAPILAWIDAGLHVDNQDKKLGNLATGSVTYDSDNKEVVTNERIFLTFKNFTDNKFCTAIKAPADNGKYYYGVKLNRNSNAGSTNGTYKKLYQNDHGYFSFYATATGTLIIKGRRSGDSGTAKVIAQIGENELRQEFSFGSGEITEVEKKISTTNGSQTIYIYTDSYCSADAEIYSIEYVQDYYLYESDREGLKISEEQPIPMYGVQSFIALQNYWPAGTTFDLNNYHATGSYNAVIGTDDETGATLTQTQFSSIPLIRSVAKVELYIPTALEPHHVYLRCANRHARWETMDVVSDTEKIWTDGHVDFSNQHSEYCEWFYIKARDPFYDPAQASSSLLDYQKQLAWYYGSWAQEGKVGNVTPAASHDYLYHYTDEDDQDHTLTSSAYPHVMNPLISRSDFIEFIDMGIDANYHKYVLYVPEKFVDDPNNIGKDTGMLAENPKVAHIEFRLKDDSFANLDDDECYRVYFIENGFKEGVTMPDLSEDANSWEKLYEQDRETLKGHWPIMRNHRYVFAVKDVSSRLAIVQLEVLPWRKTQDISVSW